MPEVKLGSTDRSFQIFILDPTATNGRGKTGLLVADIKVAYSRTETDNDVTVSDVTSSMNAITNLTDPHNDWGWKEVSSTLMPGVYRIDPADALFAAGAWEALLYVMFDTDDAAPAVMRFDLVAVDKLDAVRGGMTALPNANADAAGGLPISDAGGLDLDAIKSKTDNLPADPADASDIASAFTSLNTKVDTIDDLLDSEIGAIKTKTDQLTFTVTGQVDANIQYVNDTEVTGDGSPGTEWGPA